MENLFRISSFCYLCCSVMYLVQPSSQVQLLDQQCVIHYSSSYKRNSSQHEGNSGNKIIDGQDETCSLPLKTSSIDLIQSINVTYIQVKNSQQHPTSIRIYVRKFRYGTGHACGRDHIIGSGEKRIISCMSLFGQSVKIVPGRRTKSFSLCELQVFNDSVKVTEGVKYEIWYNKTNDDYSFVNTVAHSVSILPTFQAPRNISDDFGVRLTTFYNAPQTGYYVFNMSCGSKCKLFIRNVETENIAKVLAQVPRDDSVPDWTHYNSWNESWSNPNLLTKGEVYEITALMVEKTGADHLRVGITFPNGSFQGPISARIFINTEASRSLKKNFCPTPDINTGGFYSRFLDNAILNAIHRLLNDQGDGNKMEVLNELERLGFKKATTLNLEQRAFVTYLVQISHFVFASVVMNLSKSDGFNFPESIKTFQPFPGYSSISFPDGAFPLGTGVKSAVYMMFKPIEEMKKMTGSRDNYLGNRVVSAKMQDDVWRNMNSSFTLVFQNTQVMIGDRRQCVYWIEDSRHKKEDEKYGRWSGDGCSLFDKNETHTICKCDHLTKFSVMFPVAKTSAKDEKNLELITYVGLSLSSVGCFLTLIFYFLLRITRTLKTIVHLNLVLSLGLADVAFLFGNFARNHEDICFVATILTFYLYLAVFAWMLVEGVHLYFLIVRVFGRTERHRRNYHIFGWGVPAVIVLITTAILRHDLVSKDHCWLSIDSSSIWIFIVPALFVIFINSLVLGAVLRTTMKLLRNDPGYRKEKSALRTLIMLVPILGTTWIFGIVAFAQKSVIFQYIFAVCNAFQGFFIFILYCVLNSEIRSEIQRLRKTWKTERELDSKRSPQNNSTDE